MPLQLERASVNLFNRIQELFSEYGWEETKLQDTVANLLTSSNGLGSLCDNGAFTQRRAENYFRSMGCAADYVFLLQDNPEALKKELTREGHKDIWERSRENYKQEGFDSLRQCYVSYLLEKYHQGSKEKVA